MVQLASFSVVSEAAPRLPSVILSQVIHDQADIALAFEHLLRDACQCTVCQTARSIHSRCTNSEAQPRNVLHGGSAACEHPDVQHEQFGALRHMPLVSSVRD